MLAANNKSGSGGFKLKSRWLNRSEQDLPEFSGKSPTSTPIGASTPVQSGYSNQMNDVSSSSNDQDKLATDSASEEQPPPPPKFPVFDNILDNIYLLKEGNKKSRDSKRTSMMCECTLPEDENVETTCCGSDCLNRVLYIECGSKCRCGDRCTNKRFQNHEYAPVEPFPAGAKGWGLRAISLIPRNTFVMEYVGEVVNTKQFRLRTKQYARDPNHKHHYFMALKGDEVIDATQKGNISRFINHSCEPNCETQKWTVDGRLRIGFFTVCDIEAGQEMTFDYRFQRYGKEAQKCYCGAPSCRGFIGGEATSVTPQRKEVIRDVTKKKDKSLRVVDFEDMLFDREFSDLLAVGTLKNRDQVVTFCRLMVRAEDVAVRMQLLDLLANTNESCLRLFIDHHGCQLLWSWMVDDQRCNVSWTGFQLAVLNILKRLPIPHRNMVEDSRLLSIVQRWAKDPASRLAKLQLSLPNDEDIIKTLLSEIVNQVAGGDTPGSSDDSPVLNDEANEPEQSAAAQEKEVTQLAETVLAQWANLKENFRIPKKNAAANASKSDKTASVSKRDESSNSAKKRTRRSSSGRRDRTRSRSRSPTSRHRHKRFRTRSRSRTPRSRTRSRSRSRSRGRYFRHQRKSRSSSRDRRREHHSSKRKHDSKHTPERLSSVVVVTSTENKKTKEERRREFEAEVLRQQEEELKKRMEQEIASVAQLQPGAPGMPAVTYSVVGSAGVYYPATQPPGSNGASFPAAAAKVVTGVVGASMASLIFDQNTSRHWWQENVTKVLVYPATEIQVAAVNGGDYSVIPHFYSDPATGLIHEVRPQASVVAMPPNVVACGDDDLAEVDMACDDDPCPRETRIAILKQEIKSLEHQLEDKRNELRCLLDQEDSSSVGSLEKHVGPLPPDWKAARDKEGNIYYYHGPTKRTQWEPPRWEDQKSKTKAPEPLPPPKKVDRHHAQKLVHKSRSHQLKRKSKPEVTKRSLTDNRRHAIKSSHHKPAAIPKKEEAKEPVVNVEKMEDSSINPGLAIKEEPQAEVSANEASLNMAGSPKTTPVTLDAISVPSTSSEPVANDAIMGQTPHGTTMAAADTSSEVAKKLKESFKGHVSNHVIKYLSTYRKPDCKVGKITNNEDFKHLARKLTHAVMEKELKHCQRVEDLRVTDSVLHKAKDYVKKYMAKIGPEYKRTNSSP